MDAVRAWPGSLRPMKAVDTICVSCRMQPAALNACVSHALQALSWQALPTPTHSASTGFKSVRQVRRLLVEVAVNAKDCTVGFKQTRAPSATQQRVCSPCEVGTFQATSNKGSCNAIKDCTAGTYIVTDATLSSDRVCGNCDGVTEFQTKVG